MSSVATTAHTPLLRLPPLHPAHGSSLHLDERVCRLPQLQVLSLDTLLSGRRGRRYGRYGSLSLVAGIASERTAHEHLAPLFLRTGALPRGRSRGWRSVHALFLEVCLQSPALHATQFPAGSSKQGLAILTDELFARLLLKCSEYCALLRACTLVIAQANLCVRYRTRMFSLRNDPAERLRRSTTSSVRKNECMSRFCNMGPL
jgi:hypothetical protein